MPALLLVAHNQSFLYQFVSLDSEHLSGNHLNSDHFRITCNVVICTNNQLEITDLPRLRVTVAQ